MLFPLRLDFSPWTDFDSPDRQIQRAWMGGRLGRDLLLVKCRAARLHDDFVVLLLFVRYPSSRNAVM